METRAMRSKHANATFKAAVSAVIFLLLTAAVSLGQVTVTLTASRQTTILPDGNTVPMWGWTCGTVMQGTTAGTSCTALTYNTATGALNAQLGGTVWQPPLIVVPPRLVVPTTPGPAGDKAPLKATLLPHVPVPLTLKVPPALPP